MTRPITLNSRRSLNLAIDRLCAKTGNEPGCVKRLLATAIFGHRMGDEELGCPHQRTRRPIPTK